MHTCQVRKSAARHRDPRSAHFARSNARFATETTNSDGSVTFKNLTNGAYFRGSATALAVAKEISGLGGLAERDEVQGAAPAAQGQAPQSSQQDFTVDTSTGGFKLEATAAIAFYIANEKLYRAIGNDKELLGAIVPLVVNGQTLYFYTDAAVVDASFKASTAIRLPGGGAAAASAWAHTHPWDGGDAFSPTDGGQVKNSGIGYYLRSENGDVRYLNPTLRQKELRQYKSVTEKERASFRGISACSGSVPCVPPL